MSTQKTLWLPKPGDQLTVGTNEIPEPGPGEVLVKIEASALNPLDWKVRKAGFYLFKEYPAILGEDGAGVVQKVGEGVKNLVKGDRVFFQGAFSNKYMTFQEYALTNAVLATKIPDNISFDQAASIISGFAPFAVATYAPNPQGMGYVSPFEQGGLGKYAGQPIVIIAGASSLGQYAIQLAKLSGFSPIITTASLSNKDLLVSLGATHVLDRKLSADALKEHVINLAGGPIPYVFDAVSLPETQQAAFGLVAPGGNLFIVTFPHVKVEEGDGRKVTLAFGSFHPPHNQEIGAKFAVELTKWLAEGAIKPNPVEVLPGGLNGVADGLDRLESNKVSAKKLIVRPPETK